MARPSSVVYFMGKFKRMDRPPSGRLLFRNDGVFDEIRSKKVRSEGVGTMMWTLWLVGVSIVFAFLGGPPLAYLTATAAPLVFWIASIAELNTVMKVDIRT